VAIADAEDALSVLFSRVRLVYKNAAAQIHPELRPVGYKVLSVIVRLGETSASVIADTLETDKAVVSRQLRVLEDAGLVVVRADDRDGRARVLTATPAAIERVRSARATQQDRLREILRSQPQTEVRAFADVLRLIAEG
jgi:DNA-binding MarR family transcriptional regulator